MQGFRLSLERVHVALFILVPCHSFKVHNPSLHCEPSNGAVFTDPGTSSTRSSSLAPGLTLPTSRFSLGSYVLFSLLLPCFLGVWALSLLPRVAKVDTKWVSSTWNMLVMYLSNSSLFKCMLDHLFYQCTKKSIENSVCISMTAMNNRETTILKTNSQGEDFVLKTMATADRNQRLQQETPG